MATNAISRQGDRVYARLDDTGTDGVFLLDGTVVRGTLGTLPQEELAYFIWRQQQDIKLKEPELRRMWAAR